MHIQPEYRVEIICLMKATERLIQWFRQDDKPIGHHLVRHRKQKEKCKEKVQSQTYPVKFGKAEREKGNTGK